MVPWGTSFRAANASKPFGTGYRAVPAIQAAIVPPIPRELLSKPQFAQLVKDIYSVIQQCLQKDPTIRPNADALVSLCAALCYSVQPLRLGRLDL